MHPHPLIAYELARQRDAERLAAAERRRLLTGADRDPVPPDPERRTDLAALAERLATAGPAGLDHELRRVIRDARSRGVEPVLLEVLADPTQPDVVRQRAFGRILVELAHGRRSPAPSTAGEHDAA